MILVIFWEKALGLQCEGYEWMLMGPHSLGSYCLDRGNAAWIGIGGVGSKEVGGDWAVFKGHICKRGDGLNMLLLWGRWMVPGW